MPITNIPLPPWLKRIISVAIVLAAMALILAVTNGESSRTMVAFFGFCIVVGILSGIVHDVFMK